MSQEDLIPSSLRLPPKREKAAQMLADGHSQADAFRALEVSKATMHRWASDLRFQARVNQLRPDTLKQAEEILEQGVAVAAQTVVEIASGKRVSLEKKPKSGEEGEEEAEDASFDVTLVNARLRAALYILDRFAKTAKLPPSKRQTNTPQSTTASDDMDEAIRRADAVKNVNR